MNRSDLNGVSLTFGICGCICAGITASVVNAIMLIVYFICVSAMQEQVRVMFFVKNLTYNKKGATRFVWCECEDGGVFYVGDRVVTAIEKTLNKPDYRAAIHIAADRDKWGAPRTIMSYCYVNNGDTVVIDKVEDEYIIEVSNSSGKVRFQLP